MHFLECPFFYIIPWIHSLFYCNKHSVLQNDEKIYFKISVPPFTFIVWIWGLLTKRVAEKITKISNPGGIQILNSRAAHSHFCVFPPKVTEPLFGSHGAIILLFLSIIQARFLVLVMTHMSYAYWWKYIFIFACVPDFPFTFIVIILFCISELCIIYYIRGKMDELILKVF